MYVRTYTYCIHIYIYIMYTYIHIIYIYIYYLHLFTHQYHTYSIVTRLSHGSEEPMISGMHIQARKHPTMLNAAV